MSGLTTGRNDAADAEIADAWSARERERRVVDSAEAALDRAAESAASGQAELAEAVGERRLEIDVTDVAPAHSGNSVVRGELRDEQ